MSLSPRTSPRAFRRVVLALTTLAACAPLEPETAPAEDTLASTQGAVVLSCGECDRVLPRGQFVSLNGANGAVAAGELICLEAGARPRAIFQNLRGTAQAPITLTNCGGAVDMTGSILIQGSQHVRLLGNGAGDAVRYGIRIDAQGVQDALQITALSTNVEVAWLEIKNPNFSGIMFKTDDVAPTAFTQVGSHIHHNYIHDTGGEGIYLGNSYYGDNAQHRLLGTRVHDNVVINAGWDGIQVGGADQDTWIHDNYVESAGIKTTAFGHQNGYQMGQGTRASFSGNVSIDTKAHGLIVIGYGGSSITNNVFINAGAPNTLGDGIWYSPRSWTRPPSVAPTGDFTTGLVANNTVIAPSEYGLELHNLAATPTNLFQNNIITTPGVGYALRHITKTWTYSHNLEASTLAAAGFAKPLDLAAIRALPPHERRAAVLAAVSPGAGSSAIDSGVDLRARGITTDAAGRPRPSGSAFDRGAIEHTAAACIPETCASLGVSCGPASDGCGGTLDCGACGVVRAINCGGGAYTASNGISFEADTLYTGGTVQNASVAIAGTTDDTLYGSYRWGSFGYSVPVPAPGSYRVTLQFADYNASSAPTRRFDVRIEDAVVLDDFSIYSAAGLSTAVDRSFDVFVDDGAVDLAFSTVSGSPLVGAIVVERRP